MNAAFVQLQSFLQRHCDSNALQRVNLVVSHDLDTLLNVRNRSRSDRNITRENERDDEKKNACVEDLAKLLRLHTTLSAAGYMNERPQWDYGGSFYFAATVVSTLGERLLGILWKEPFALFNLVTIVGCIVNVRFSGYGMTTPRTMAGRLCVIVYGLIGCGACMLLFNLFMERTVTVFAILLRKWSSYKVRKRYQPLARDIQSSNIEYFGEKATLKLCEHCKRVL